MRCKEKTFHCLYIQAKILQISDLFKVSANSVKACSIFFGFDTPAACCELTFRILRSLEPVVNKNKELEADIRNF
jgi:hypothetical protein